MDPTQQLDPGVVMMMRAIATKETPSGQATPGASGELPSRFQYTPGTWRAVAGRYLGDSNAPLNSANENKATYYRIKSWKDAGKQPYEIAAMWNAGEKAPDAWDPVTGHEGVNTYGVKYDTPTYVRDVVTNLKNLSAKQKSINSFSQPDVVNQQQPATSPGVPHQPAIAAGSQQPRQGMEGVADVLNQGGPLKTAAGMFRSTGKFIGGGLLNATNLAAANSADMAGLYASNQHLNDIDQKAIQEARAHAQAGDTTAAERLLKVVQSHGANTTANDILPNSQQNNPEEIAGAGLGTLAEQSVLATGGGGATAASETAGTVGTRGARIWQGVKTGAKMGAIFGGLQGAGSAMEQDKTIGGVAAGTAAGAGVGVAAGGILGGLIGALPLRGAALGQQVHDEAQQKYVEAMNLGKAEFNKLDPGEETKVADFMLQHGAVLDTMDNGTKFDTRSQAVPILEKGRDQVEENLQSVLNEFKGYKMIDSGDINTDVPAEGTVRARAYEYIDNTNNLNPTDAKSRKAAVDELLSDWQEKNGSTLFDPPTANQAKRSMNFSYDRDASSAKIEAGRALRSGFQTSIEDGVSNVGGGDIVNSLNEKLGEYQKYIDFVDSMHGKAVRGGRLGKMLGKLAGEITGSIIGGHVGHPFLGMMAGKEVAGAFEDMINNPARITQDAVDAMQAQGFIPESVKTVQQAQDFVNNIRLQRATTLGLPEPAIQMGQSAYKPFTPEEIAARQPVPGVQVARPGQLQLPAGTGETSPTIYMPPTSEEVSGGPPVAGSVMGPGAQAPQAGKNIPVIEGEVVSPKAADNVIVDAEKQITGSSQGSGENNPELAQKLENLRGQKFKSWGDLYTKMTDAVGHEPQAEAAIKNHLQTRWSNYINEPELSAEATGPEFEQQPTIPPTFNVTDKPVVDIEKKVKPPTKPLKK